MAIIANTFLTFQAKGDREDLTDIIWNIDPVQTPFTTSIARAKATAVLHEWQTDSLANTNTSNAQIQGDDISSFDSVTPTVRLNNYTQISRKTVIISRTQQTVLKAGRKSEVALQLAKKAKELRRDIEAILVGTNQAKAAGSSSAASNTASALSWIVTNTDKGAGGSDPGASDGTGTRTDGTQRSFVESSLKSVLLGIFNSTAEDPDICLLPGKQKQVASTFTGNQTKMQDTSDKRLVAAIDIYIGDFNASGLRMMPDRFMRTRDALVLNTELWALAWLDPIRQDDLAKTGDTAAKKLLIGEYALECHNEKGSGGVFDLS
jgi:hypothetical protein